MTALTTCRLLGFTPQAVEPPRVESMKLGAHWFVVLYTVAERGWVGPGAVLVWIDWRDVEINREFATNFVLH